MITDLLTSGAMHSLKSVFQKKKERNVIIDPFSCLVKLSLIRYLDEGTKISIYQNRLNFNAPSYIQGIVRFVYGDNREDLHNILLPIQKCVEWYWNERNVDMIYMFNNAVLGLKFLKNSYSTYATIQHTLDYYIIILMQKNSAVMSQMGISTIDIEKLTTALQESNANEINTLSNASASSSSEKGKNKEKHDIKDSREYDSRDSRDSKEKNNKITDKSTLVYGSTKSNEITESIEQDKNTDRLQLQMRDIHKFLFELWNEREIGIVINLYREMETKHQGAERSYIYNNIMQYCEMKENKLYKYIEQNSSIL